MASFYIKSAKTEFLKSENKICAIFSRKLHSLNNSENITDIKGFYMFIKQFNINNVFSKKFNINNVFLLFVFSLSYFPCSAAWNMKPLCNINLFVKKEIKYKIFNYNIDRCFTNFFTFSLIPQSKKK